MQSGEVKVGMDLLLLFLHRQGSQGSSRRSGRFPVLPYPPLEQMGLLPRVFNCHQSECFPFPFPWGSISGKRETAGDCRGSLDSWRKVITQCAHCWWERTWSQTFGIAFFIVSEAPSCTAAEDACKPASSHDSKAATSYDFPPNSHRDVSHRPTRQSQSDIVLTDVAKAD